MNPTDNRRFADLINQQLLAKGWTQKKFAEYVEKDESTVSLWLSGRKSPSVVDKKALGRLAKFLGLTPGEVQQILSEQKERSEVGPQKKATVIRSLPELESVLKEEKLLVDQAFPYNTRLTAKSVKEFFLYHDFDVSESLISEFLKTGSEFKKFGDGYARCFLVKQTDTLSRLRSHVRVRSVIRQACARLNDSFDRAKNRHLSKEAILNLVSEVVLSNRELAEGRWREEIVSTLLEKLEEWRLIEKLPNEETYQQRWLINPEYVINKLFGLPTGLGGLDFLLDGGLLSPTRAGVSMLIEGRPGAGKSMIALQMAAKFATCGNVSVYFSAEMELYLLVERLAFLGFAIEQKTDFEMVASRRKDKMTVLSWRSIEGGHGPDLAKYVGDGGLLLLVSISNRKNFYGQKNSIVNNLVSLSRSLQEQKDVYACYVIDSLDAVIKKRSRGFLEKIFNVGKQPMTIGIFLSEERRETPENLRDYLVDVVVRMGAQEIKGNSQRVIEVAKCRTQHHIRGRHVFSINSGEGVGIYPSVQALLSLWRRCVRWEQSTYVESWNVDENLNLDPLIHNDIISGYSILLTGTPGTHKFPLGLTFLSSGIKSRSDQCLVISLREDEAAIFRLIKYYQQLTPLADSLTALFVPPDYFSAERLVNRIQRTLDAIKKDGKRVSRILFSGLSQIEHNSPMFNEEPMFIAALIELFKKERVTSMFLNSSGGGKIENANLFDMVIFSEKLTARERRDHEQYDVKLAIPHHGPSKVDSRPHRLGIKHIVNGVDGNSGLIMLGPPITLSAPPGGLWGQAE